MAKPIWHELSSKISIHVSKGWSPDVPSREELESTLDEYESRTGTRLPKSYREFLHWFGPGELAGSFRIYSPTPERLRGRGRAADAFDLDKRTEAVHDPRGWWASECDPTLLSQLVLLASTIGGDWFFWDTADVRDARKHEYGVYGHRHGEDAGEVRLIAASFAEFVTAVCLGTGFPGSDDRWEPEWRFRSGWPNKPRKKK